MSLHIVYHKAYIEVDDLNFPFYAKIRMYKFTGYINL